MSNYLKKYNKSNSSKKNISNDDCECDCPGKPSCLELAKQNNKNYNSLYKPLVERIYPNGDMNKSAFFGTLDKPGLIDKLVNSEDKKKYGYSYDNVLMLDNLFSVPKHLQEYTPDNEKEYIEYWNENPSINTNKRKTRKIPEMTPRLQELQDLILSYNDEELAKTLSKDYSKMGMLNFGKFLPKGVGAFKALKYYNHLKDLTKSNTFDKGGLMSNTNNNDQFNSFDKGGSHEANPLGGIPMGVGSNGKMNTVEQNETSFDFEDGKYIFSDRLSFDIKTNKLSSKSNNNEYANGGIIDPKKQPLPSTNSEQPKGIFPPQGGYTVNPFKDWGAKTEYNSDISYPIEFLKRNHRTATTGQPHPLEERRDSFMAYPAGQDAYVDFDKAIRNETSRQFLNRYNDPVTRQRLKDQAGIDDKQIDNMILQGLHPTLELGALGPRTNGAFMLSTPNKVFVDPKSDDPQATETHERIHSSNIDSLMGEKIQDVMGSSFKQNKSRSMRHQSPGFLEYMNKPHETYANFADLRETLELKPGEQIDLKELEKRIKAKKLEDNNFYKTYDNERIVKALNTIAYNSNLINKYKDFT